MKVIVVRVCLISYEQKLIIAKEIANISSCLPDWKVKKYKPGETVPLPREILNQISTINNNEEAPKIIIASSKSYFNVNGNNINVAVINKSHRRSRSNY